MDKDEGLEIVISLAKYSLNKNVTNLIWSFLKQNWTKLNEHLDTDTLKVK